MTDLEKSRGFESHPDPEHPGWFTWNLRDPTRFNGSVMGPMIVRREDDGKVRTRMTPERRHTNLADNLHGGTILSLIDVAMFSTSRLNNLIEAGTSVTLDMSVQFIGAGKPDRPLDAVGQVLKETRRLIFLRGTVEQADELVAAWSGTVRKPTAR
jgi:uncharacterized protein (TIGR00369 family)